MPDPRLMDHALEGPAPSTEQLEHARQLAARVAREPASLAALDEAMAELEMADMVVWDLWYSTFAEIAREEPTRRRAWVRELRAGIDSLVAQPDALVHFRDDPASLRRATEQWRRVDDPAEAWFAHRSDTLIDWDDLLPYLELLSRVDPGPWCESLDGLPNPGLMHLALSLTSVGEDRERLVEMLEHAPAMLDPDGRWLPSRSVAALLVAKHVVEHLSKHRVGGVGRPLSAEEEDSNAELRAWLERAFSVLVARADGIPLGVMVLARLARDDLFRSAYGSDDRVTSNQAALHVLAECLARQGCTLAAIRQGWERSVERKVGQQSQSPRSRGANEVPRGEGARTIVGLGLPFLHGACLALPESASKQELEELWGWTRELLRGGDDGLGLIQPGTPPAQEVPGRLGVVLAYLEEPDVQWLSAYTELEPQRRRACFGLRYQTLDGDRESMMLIRIGLHAAASWAARNPARTQAAQRLFWTIHREARRLWLTETSDHQRIKQDLVAVCFAYMPVLFGEALGEALHRALPPLATAPELVVRAASMLARNVDEPISLLGSFEAAGVPLDTALRNAKQWSNFVDDPRENRHGIPSVVFPPHFGELARALGIALDEQSVSVPTLEQSLTALERSVPWAAALRERMADDRLEIEWLTPLEDRREWLIQASVPEPLRERFGLAPALRVLAVHGQVRGRMLRLATLEPRGSERVDPDLLVIVSDQIGLERRLPTLAGPWGQRVAWSPSERGFAPIGEELGRQLPRLDLFDYRDPVRGRALIGRESEIDDIAARLARGEAIGVFGLRKVGKSSLLRAVAERLDPIGARLGMFESLTVPLPRDADVEALVVSLDVQGLGHRDLETLVEHLGHELEERLTLSGVIEPRANMSVQSLAVDVDPLARFDDMLDRALERTDQTLCFVFDEYDLLFEGYNGQSGIAGVERLLASLRARGQSTQRIGLAFIGRDPTFLQQPQLGGTTSPLPMRTKPVFLGPLQRAEADELLHRLGRRVGLTIGSQIQERAWRMTGGHPLLLRQFGSVLFEHAKASDASAARADEDLVDRAVESFMSREVVYTLCSEVDALLRARYPQAHALLEAISSRAVHEPRGEHAQAREVLLRFGILVADPRPWVPEVYRAWFGGTEIVLERGA